MKAIDKSENQKIFHEKLNKVFSGEQQSSLLLTLLGMSTIFGEWCLEVGAMKLPIKVRYALVQLGHIGKVLSMVAQEVDPKKIKEYQMEYLPDGEDSWKTDDDFYQRYKFVVKAYYESMKKNDEI